MREPIKQRRLRLWKERQTADGYDVSKVMTLEEAEHFFDNEPKKEILKGEMQIDSVVQPLANQDDNTLKTNKYESMNWQELQDLGKTLGLKVIGVKKDELIENIKNAEEQLAAMNNSILEPPVDANPSDPTPGTNGSEETITLPNPTSQLTEEQLAAMNNSILEPPVDANPSDPILNNQE